ncbi:MAG: hypothetical protein WD904_00775 [Dehalococcoidia bacterium]
MTNRETIIHIDWDGPYTLDTIKGLKGSTDFGVYQIYGGGPVYGGSALLYIGRACDQYFATRIPQEVQWLDNRDAARVEVYVGRLSGARTPDNDAWVLQIKLAERLLISAHSPPHNTQKNLGALERDLWSVHVLNWGHRRDLVPEVSGARWTTRFDDPPNYHAFSEDELE